MVQYRPILVAKRGELTALAGLPTSVWTDLTPVMQIPPREWDFDRGTYKKSLDAHLQDLPKKLAIAIKSHRAFVDLSLLDSTAPVFGGRHPLAWFVDEAGSHGLELTPLVLPSSDAAFLASVSDVRSRLGRGVGIRLHSDYWTTINPAVLPRLTASSGVTQIDVDLFLDLAGEFGPVPRRALLTELAALDGGLPLRSRSVGGSAFPDTAGLAKGLSEFPRDDWTAFVDTYRARFAAGESTPDFFDCAVQNPRVELGLINPRFLMISALFRYTVDQQWLLAKGDLFKGPAGGSLGSAAMVTPLTLLHAHPLFASPTRTAADDWIDAVLAGTHSPGNPESWRRWANQRHITVVTNRLSSPI